METNHNPRLFLIPNILSDDNTMDFIPQDVKLHTHHLKQFVVENEKSARALIKKLTIATPQNELTVLLWNEHSKKEDFPEVAALFKHGDVGVISEAGIPCVADPGADIVYWAHKKNIRVVPLPGSSSILMALMASGFNGQSFVFHGYLPFEKPRRFQKIKEMCIDASKKHQSQIFMEAPYRNNQLLEDVLKNTDKHTKLCIACHISGVDEMIATKSTGEWATQVPDLHKKPTLFIIGSAT